MYVSICIEFRTFLGGCRPPKLPACFWEVPSKRIRLRRGSETLKKANKEVEKAEQIGGKGRRREKPRFRPLRGPDFRPFGPGFPAPPGPGFPALRAPPAEFTGSFVGPYRRL